MSHSHINSGFTSTSCSGGGGRWLRWAGKGGEVAVGGGVFLFNSTFLRCPAQWLPSSHKHGCSSALVDKHTQTEGKSGTPPTTAVVLTWCGEKNGTQFGAWLTAKGVFLPGGPSDITSATCSHSNLAGLPASCDPGHWNSFAPIDFWPRNLSIIFLNLQIIKPAGSDCPLPSYNSSPRAIVSRLQPCVASLIDLRLTLSRCLLNKTVQNYSGRCLDLFFFERSDERTCLISCPFLSPLGQTPIILSSRSSFFSAGCALCSRNCPCLWNHSHSIKQFRMIVARVWQ